MSRQNVVLVSAGKGVHQNSKTKKTGFKINYFFLKWEFLKHKAMSDLYSAFHFLDDQIGMFMSSM